MEIRVVTAISQTKASFLTSKKCQVSCAVFCCILFESKSSKEKTNGITGRLWGARTSKQCREDAFPLALSIRSSGTPNETERHLSEEPETDSSFISVEGKQKIDTLMMKLDH